MFSFKFLREKGIVFFVADDRYGSRNIYYNNTYVIVEMRKERSETVTFDWPCFVRSVRLCTPLKFASGGWVE